jgi:hypothetical protein
MTVVALPGACAGMTDVDLATSSTRTRTRSFTSVPESWPASGPSKVQSAHRCAGSILAGTPAAARPPKGSHAARQYVTQRPACPPARPIPDPVPLSPTRTVRSPLTAVRSRPAEPVLCSAISLPVPLTGLALAHRPGQVKPRGLAAAPEGRPAQAWPGFGCRLQQSPRPASFLVAAAPTRG